MVLSLAAVGLVAAAVGAPGPQPPARYAPVRADLAVHARSAAARDALGGVDGPRAGTLGAPPCLGDVCQPRVSVLGYDPSYQRPSRTDLALSYLDRVRLEPFASIAWALLATGLRFEYNPPVFDAASQGPAGWGSVFVRVRFRVDAENHPVVPKRPRDQHPAVRGDS
ncbi:MAG TPA: hypothetical protein VFK90_14060 [Anaeromyxobacter sp.]|nr:hypothetical protein [Anaeromyxobacter sp.]